MESAALDLDMERLSIYKAARTIKRRDNTLYNALRSIYEDSIFVGEISQIWPELPLLANLRCGLWYSSNFQSTCYFKSTDGHTNNWSFNTSRLNLHVALLSGQKGGCMIVDSTRKGKRFPDSMSKTIPIWTCVLNRAIFNYRNRSVGGGSGSPQDRVSSDWDWSLHLPLWVSETEKLLIEDRLEGWTAELEASGADIASLALSLEKPLRPLWISHKTVIWLNEVPEYDSWDFTPIMLVSASSPSGAYQQKTTSEFSWNYIPGAGDDEESWARGLSPNLFWKHAYDLINSGPNLCNQKVADIVEKDRVYRAQRGGNASQISVRPSKFSRTLDDLPIKQPMELEVPNLDENKDSSSSSTLDNSTIFWLDLTNVAVGATRLAMEISCSDSLLSCGGESLSRCLENAEAYLHLQIVSSKFDRFSLFRNLPYALDFARLNLRQGKRLIICCNDGQDISICVCLAILVSLFNDKGQFDDGKSFSETHMTKSELRRRLVFICKFAVNARPSRGNLKQVFNYLSGGSAGNASSK
ncbi:tRNA A64-2'-O-ribosylphosphate transferase-like isoform X1 [Coffea eugenioides]|uniref:tRNA A64-2'-O-ribosylphosphate transferase-like isoform X1 n=2 Tax=Coffea eugenioides TaxID=49369 RepID=UPI000F604876|nr:tRNA A64-2'-O-ribosylphosphate transferase-like isoform X1 [Coffea eugenioides]